MKRIVLASLLFATPALAQQQPPPGMRAWQLMQQQADLREQNATAAALAAQDQIQKLQAEVTDLQKQVDDAKKKDAPTK